MRFIKTFTFLPQRLCFDVKSPSELVYDLETGELIDDTESTDASGFKESLELRTAEMRQIRNGLFEAKKNLQRTQDEKERCQRELAELSGKAHGFTELKTALEQEIAHLNEQITQNQQRINELDTIILDIDNDLRTLDREVQDLSQKIESEKVQQSQLEASYVLLSEEVRQSQVMLDHLKTSAALAEKIDLSGLLIPEDLKQEVAGISPAIEAEQRKLQDGITKKGTDLTDTAKKLRDSREILELVERAFGSKESARMKKTAEKSVRHKTHFEHLEKHTELKGREAEKSSRSRHVDEQIQRTRERIFHTEGQRSIQEREEASLASSIQSLKEHFIQEQKGLEALLENAEKVLKTTQRSRGVIQATELNALRASIEQNLPRILHILYLPDAELSIFSSDLLEKMDHARKSTLKINPNNPQQSIREYFNTDIQAENLYRRAIQELEAKANPTYDSLLESLRIGEERYRKLSRFFRDGMFVSLLKAKSKELSSLSEQDSIAISSSLQQLRELIRSTSLL